MKKYLVVAKLINSKYFPRRKHWIQLWPLLKVPLFLAFRHFLTWIYPWPPKDILQLCTEHILKPKFTLIRNGSILCFWVFLQGYIRHVRDILQFHSRWSYLQLGCSMSRHKEDEQMLTSLDIPLSFTVLILGKLYYVSTLQFSFSFSDRKGK